MKIPARVVAAGVLTLGFLTLLPTPEHADAAAWVLALPPVKEHAKADVPDVRSRILEELDRQAPVNDWRPGQSFANGSACEDARLSALKRFDQAADAAGDGTASDETIRHLTQLGETAFGRCVPAMTFGANAAE